MLTSIVVKIKALEDGEVTSATGKYVQGLWFNHLNTISSQTADKLHDNQSIQPYSLSPLMQLSHPERGKIIVRKGSTSWFRIAVLTNDFSDLLIKKWLPELPGKIKLGKTIWEVEKICAQPGEHPWAARSSINQLVSQKLLNKNPPPEWSFYFLTPMASRFKEGHLPFPLPGALIGSWLRRWNALGNILIPAELQKTVDDHIFVSAYNLKTIPVREERRVKIGCIGSFTMKARDMSPGERAAVDFLAAYSFYCGSGHHTTQGFGMTEPKIVNHKNNGQDF